MESLTDGGLSVIREVPEIWMTHTISLSNTHTYTQTLSFTHTHTHTHTHTLSLSICLSLFLTHTLCLCLSLFLSLSHTYTHTYILRNGKIVACKYVNFVLRFIRTINYYYYYYILHQQSRKKHSPYTTAGDDDGEHDMSEKEGRDGLVSRVEKKSIENEMGKRIKLSNEKEREKKMEGFA